MSFICYDTATTENYTLSLHDALPIYEALLHNNPRSVTAYLARYRYRQKCGSLTEAALDLAKAVELARSEEHTSELQSHVNLVCRLLLEKKNTILYYYVLTTQLHYDVQ